MSKKILFANAIDYMRTVNDNLVDNALGERSSYVLLPSLYKRAHVLAYETGELPLTDNFVAPDESITRSRRALINLKTSDS